MTRNDVEDSPRASNSNSRMPHRFRTAAITACSTLAAVILAYSGTAVVGPNQVACFRTLGVPDCGPLVQKEVEGKTETTHEYYSQGLHFKWPLFTSIDVMQVSQRLTQQHTAKLTLGQQNQPAEVDYQLMVDIPKYGKHLPDGKYVDSVYHLMYQIGEAGSSDVDNVVDKFVDAGLNKAFASTEPDDMSTKRAAILNDVTAQVGNDLSQLGVSMDSDIKVTRSELLGSWKEAANLRVLSIGKKNAAANEAEAAKMKGQGEGDAILEKAKKQALATKEITEADANYITKMRASFGNDSNALAVFLMTKSGTQFPQVLGAEGVRIVPALRPMAEAANAPAVTAPAAAVGGGPR